MTMTGKTRIVFIALAALLALLGRCVWAVTVRSDPLPEAEYSTDGTCGPGTCLVKCCGDCPADYYPIPESECGFYFVELDAPAPFAQSWHLSAPFVPDAVFGTTDEPMEVCLGYVEPSQVAACLLFDLENNPDPHRVEILVRDNGIVASEVLPERNEPSFAQFIVPVAGRLCLRGNASSLVRCEIRDRPVTPTPPTGFQSTPVPLEKRRVYVPMVIR